MQNDLVINDELKKLLVSDKDIERYFLISLLHNVYKSEDPKEHEQYFYNEYQVYDSLINKENKVIDRNSLKASLLSVFKDMVSNDMIDEVLNDYTELALNEGKSIIYTLSRLLYLQDKYKNDEIGQEIDEKIKEWLEYINEVSKDDKLYTQDIFKSLSDNEKQLFLNKLDAFNLYEAIPSINYDIYYNDKDRVNYNPRRKFMDLWNYNNVKMIDLKEYIFNFINNKVRDSRNYERYTEIINGFINTIEDNANMALFEDDQATQIQAIKDKYGIKDVQQEDGKTAINLEDLKDPFLDEITQLYTEWRKYNDYDIQTTYDIKKWRDKADTFIKHLLTYDKEANLDLFNMDYMLTYLAYNEYQKQTYKTTREPKVTKVTPVKRPRLNKDELKEKYKDLTLLNGEKLDYNRKWARVDTSKVNSNIIDLRESITKRVANKTDLTRKKITQIEKKPKPSKEDLDQLKELKTLLKEQQQEQEVIIKEVKDLKADLDLIDKQISDTTEAKQIKTLSRKRNKIQKEISEKEAILRNEGIFLQTTLFNDKLLVAEKTNPKTKESYKLMINNDYDIQNFNSEGRNFLYYIPNIPNIINELNEDFINVDINDYLDFTGRPTGNVSRIRKNLQNTLKEMRKESYDYTYLDDKGVLHDDSLVLIGDIKGTEYKGKASVKVQLGATFKDNLKQAFIKSQYVKVNSDVFKIGQGRNNKAENMAKEIFLYLAKLCRIEAKSQLNGGKWRKDVHLDTIITKLAELNLINYNPYRYNESVKEPLLYALNTGVELGYFTYETDAFKYYDDVINTLNKGANVQDKITNFEKGDKYGVKFIINGDMVDLENNAKASKTYNKYKNKNKNKGN